MSVRKYARKLSKYIDDMGPDGVDAVAEELNKRANAADEPWQAALINLAADGISKFGPEGVRYVSKAIEDLFSGKGATTLKDVTDDLETASDLLAAMQNAEAERKSKARDFLKVLGSTLAKITKGFIKGLI